VYDDYDSIDDVQDNELFSERMSFQDIIQTLQQRQDRPPEEDLLYGLSNLSDEEARQLWPVWQKLGTDYKLILMQMLADAVESDFQLDYSRIAFWGMDDEDDDVRRAAIEALGEDESAETLERLLRMGRHDVVAKVRAEAMGALGRFVLLGELGRMNPDKAQAVQEYVLETYHNTEEVALVRQRALEAIGNCTRDDIGTLIRQAYEEDDPNWRRSALIAMGKTADEAWTTVVLRELDNQDEDMRREAARAAGELQLRMAVLRLVEILHEDERDLREVAAWSLGEIGGKQALRALKQAAKRAESDDDDELLEIIEDAIGNASLMEGAWLS